MEMPPTLLEFRQYYKGTEIKTANTVAQKQTYESMEQIESLKINAHTYSPLIYNKEDKNI